MASGWPSRWTIRCAKKLNGRKRHLLADTLGLVLRAKVHAANIRDRAAVPQVRSGIKDGFWRLLHVWVGQGYTGAGQARIDQELVWSVEVVSMSLLCYVARVRPTLYLSVLCQASSQSRLRDDRPN